MIRTRYQLEPVSPGAILREELQKGSAIGIQADQCTSQGSLVPDALVISLIQSWLEKHPARFVFDGFPRTIPQGESLDALLTARQIPLEAVLYFSVSEETIKGRVLNR